ncbi:nitronate monooxygenase [Streptacidiphilus sp. PAMC 29251]
MRQQKQHLTALGLALPVLAAPMAGGSGTPALVVSAAGAGSLGFLAAGYLGVPALAEQIATVRAADVPFGVNVFAPNPVPIEPAVFREYARTLKAEAESYGLDLAGDTPISDDDGWAEKIDLLLAEPVPVVSFTFGLPDPAVVTALRRAGTLVLQTVTSVAEAEAAADGGVDALVVQAAEAGGHSGTLTPQRPPVPLPLADLLAGIGQAVTLPLVAAGGLATAAGVAEAIGAGAAAVMVGTVLLRTHQSGASAVHRAALADGAGRGTVVTRAFTGRPARALRNEFTDAHSADAPLGYPALHHLTSPLRRAAVAAGDRERVHLWAGTGYAEARAEDAVETLVRLAAEL